MTAPLLRVAGLSVRVGFTRHEAVRGVSFELRAGERIALLGPSGCGKTTTLRAIAGFERAAEGRIELEGKVIADAQTHVPPHRRGLGMVFQDFALFPHLDVTENVAFGLTTLRSGERRERVRALLELAGLGGLEARRPAELSGGQQQRVALARALAPHPRVLLLDEPFASLDAGLRVATRAHTERVLASVGAAAVLVTHDQDEALAFAERLFVLRDGRIEQAGTPEQVYGSPRTAFVARFLGAANVVEGQALGDRAETVLGVVALQSPAHGTVSLCVRPEAFELGLASGGVAVRIVAREYLGSRVVYEVEREGGRWTVSADAGAAPWSVGDRLAVAVRRPVAVLGPE